jgi:uncharacterized protein YlxW (UPF0749 family)
MKEHKWIVMMIFTLVGLSLGLLFSIEDPSASEEGSMDRAYEQEIEQLAEINENLRQRITDVQENVETFEENLPAENLALTTLRQEIRTFEMLAGRQDVTGPGIEIILSSREDENIAMIVEYRKYLINLLNELRVFGGEAFEVNGHRIVDRTELTLAGNHINVNQTPIAPPYLVRSIGNQAMLEQYVEYNTFIFDMMENDGIAVDINFPEELIIEGYLGEKAFRYFEVLD